MHCPAGNELVERLSEAATNRKGYEDHKSTRKCISTADDISKASKYDGATKVSKRVCQCDPGDIFERVEFCADGVQRGGDDGSVN